MMPVAQLAGIDLHYEVGGNGPPLILVAGMMSDSASWAPLVPALEQRFTVVRPDNRSTGRTRPTDAPCGLAEWAGDLVALMDHLGLPQAHLAGHSLGGLIALHLVAMAPARVGRLALLAAAPLPMARNLALFRHLLALRGPDMPPDLWLRGLFPWLFHPRLFDDPQVIDGAVAQSLAYPHAQDPAAMARQLAALERVRAELRLPDPFPPALALLGADDLLLPAGPARAALPDVPAVIIEGAAHSVHWDAPGPVAHHLIRHLEGTP
jgi:pimeloyl-ACP methyl ester carboxylesterase